MATVVTRAMSLDGDGNGVCPFKAAKGNEWLFSLPNSLSSPEWVYELPGSVIRERECTKVWRVHFGAEFGLLLFWDLALSALSPRAGQFSNIPRRVGKFFPQNV